MDDNTAMIPGLVRLSFRDPRAAARAVLALDLPTPILWQGLLLVVILSVILARVTAMLLGPPMVEGEDPMMPAFFADPLQLGFVQGCLLVVMVFAVHWVGRSFGGSGSFDGALALVAWLQFLLVCLQAVQTVAMLVLPPLSGLVTIAGIVVFFWLLTQFLCELHGFDSPAMVFLMVLVSMLTISFGLVILFSIMGLVFLGGVPDV